MVKKIKKAPAKKAVAKKETIKETKLTKELGQVEISINGKLTTVPPYVYINHEANK